MVGYPGVRATGDSPGPMQAIVNSSQTKAPTRNAARGGLTGALRVSHRRARDRPTDSPTDPGSHGGSRPMTAHGGETKAASKMRGASDGRRGSGPRHRAGQSPRGPCRGPSPSPLAVLVPCSCTEASSAARPSRSSRPPESQLPQSAPCIRSPLGTSFPEDPG